MQGVSVHEDTNVGNSQAMVPSQPDLQLEPKLRGFQRLRQLAEEIASEALVALHSLLGGLHNDLQR